MATTKAQKKEKKPLSSHFSPLPFVPRRNQKNHGPAVQPQRAPQGLCRPLCRPRQALEARRRLQRARGRGRQTRGRARGAARRRVEQRGRRLLLGCRSAVLSVRSAADYCATPAAAVLRVPRCRWGGRCRGGGRGEPSDAGREKMDAMGFPFFFFLMGEGATFQVLLFSSLGHSPAFHSAAGLFFASSSCRPCREMWIAKEGTRRKKRRSRCFIRRDGALLKPIHQTSFFLPLRDSRCLSFLPCSASSRHDILCLVEKKDRGKKLELEGGTRQRSTHASNFIAVSLALSLVPPPPP